MLVHRRVARVLDGHPKAARILVLGDRVSLRQLRRTPYDAVVDCGNWTAPSVHNAILARLASAPGSELAPPTDLDALAALMRAAGLTVCNNTGPMHLSVAVGAPTLAFFLRMDRERWGHPQPPHAMVDFTDAADAGLPLEPLAEQAVQRFVEGGSTA